MNPQSNLGREEVNVSVHVIVPMKVQDYPFWKETFDKLSKARVGWSAEGYVIYRGVERPEAVVVIHYFADRDGARKFLNDPTIQSSIAHFNDDKLPDLDVFEEVERLF